VVQTSTVELFAAYSVAVAPVYQSGGRRVACPAVGTVAVIGFDAPGFAGRLCIHVADPVLLKMCTGTTEGHSVRDWCRELANQLLGRIKNRLVRFQVTLRIRLVARCPDDGVVRKRATGASTL
jgi:hypothetical protein